MRKFFIYFFSGVLLLLVFLLVYLVIVTHVSEPEVSSSHSYQREILDSNYFSVGKNFLRKHNSGLWEMYVEGDAFERGVINGKLSRELIYEQEKNFNEQIEKLVPSEFYRYFLKFFVGWFNRNLDENITDEYKLELFGISQSASGKFDYIAPAFQRLMNYHAAHDIGHTLQNLMLVGCSSFARWDENTMIAGRNFDFYVGDKFAENKIVFFCKPKNGYNFMMITWPGMIGAVSGMNAEGLSVTINALPSEIPSGSATPVSLVAREIVQYAKNISEAITIANNRKTFVSESFFICSATDNKAVIIEKTLDTTAVFFPSENYLICTNHYQTDSAKNHNRSKDNASQYRYQRIKELMKKNPENTPEQTAAILRNQLGMNDKFIGWGNEKAVNQLISHHAVIFEPKKKKVWVSTSPFQLGKFVAYELEKVFSLNENIIFTDTIPADTFLLSSSFSDFIKFKKLEIKTEEDVELLITLNPEYYNAYVRAGDYMFENKKYSLAKKYYETALQKEIATEKEKQYILSQIEKCQ